MYFEKISKDRNILFKYYKINKSDSNISKMLSCINTAIFEVFGPDFLEKEN